MPAKNKSKGFSLVEILITLAILGIIMAIAIPNYRVFVLKGNRSEGMAILNEIMQAQERYAAANGTYANTLTLLGYTNPQLSALPGQYYSVGVITAGVDTCVTAGLPVCVKLVATAVAPQDNDDNGNDGDLSLNSRGTKEGW